MEIRAYREQDIREMVRIWNEVVEEGVAFPQLDLLDEETGKSFFDSQTYCGVADDDGKVVGLYILHPNNIGRCGHIANASYAVDSSCRGKHIGEKLCRTVLLRRKSRALSCYSSMRWWRITSTRVIYTRDSDLFSWEPFLTDF